MTTRMRKLPDNPTSKMTMYAKVKDIFCPRLRRAGGGNFEPTCLKENVLGLFSAIWKLLRRDFHTERVPLSPSLPLPPLPTKHKPVFGDIQGINIHEPRKIAIILRN
jgi:hypothetical protein